MHILILGGSGKHLGGVEAFCERSAEALLRRDPTWRIKRIATETAYLTFKRIPVMAGQLRKLIEYRKNKPDIAWVQYVNLPDLAYVVVARLLGLTVMVTPHLGSNWRSQQNPFLRWLSGSILGRAHRIALISRTQRLEIPLPASVPLSLIRNFLPETVLTGDLPAGGFAAPSFQLIHSARLSVDKGTFMVVEVAKAIRDRGIPFVVRITGSADPDTYAKLDAMIADYGLGDQVIVMGRVTENVLLETLRQSDVLIHLSRIDSYPLILLEAIACSMLPIAMELAGARDMIETFDGQVVSQAQPVDETVAWIAAADLIDVRRRGRIEAERVRREYAWERCACAAADALAACKARSLAATEPVTV